MRAFRHRDFRLLWFGAFFSFLGSWIQNVAQGWLVFNLTGSEAKLGLVSFLAFAPSLVLSPAAGALVDRFDKRRVLVFTQSVMGIGALALGVLAMTKTIAYEHILIVAFVVGVASCVDVPTRMSIVTRVVPREDLPSAIPLNAMAFNGSRVIGPAIGGLILAHVGVGTCYLMNGISYLALIFAVLAITADLKAIPSSPMSFRASIEEGMRYMFGDPRFRALFMMETVLAVFGLFYLPLMPAVAKVMLGLDKVGLGNAMTAVGVGSVIGLYTISRLSHRSQQGVIALGAMLCFGFLLTMLSFTSSPLLAFPVLGLLGCCAVMQLNSTNTVFQLYSPESMRGRIMGVHAWALTGIGPLGILPFSFLAEQPAVGLRWALRLGALFVLVAALWVYIWRRSVLHTSADEDDSKFKVPKHDESHIKVTPEEPAAGT